MKLLLYCIKAKPKLMISCKGEYKLEKDFEIVTDRAIVFNGKIVAECDFDVEEIELLGDEINIYYGIENKACLTTEEIENYLGYDNDYKGYAIYINNLHIFDEPRKLYDCLIHPKIETKYYGCEHLNKAPKNMMYVELDDVKYILVSIRAEQLCKILNGKKTIEIRKKVLKEMLKNK